MAAVSWAGRHGYTRLSLNFSPFAGLLTTEAALPSARRLPRRALLRLKGMLALQLDNLQRFNGQFCPAWHPRYVILQAWAALPRVLVAAMAAEGYPPCASLIRGRNWSPAPGPALPGPAASIGPLPVVAAGTGPAQVPAHLQRS